VGEKYEEADLRSALVGYANPTLELLKEAARAFGGDSWVATVISIGGKLIIPPKEITLAQRLEAILKDTDTVHQNLYHRLHQLNLYFRLEIPYQLILFNESRNIKQEIQAYKSDGRVNQLINEAVRSIHLRQQMKTISELSKYRITLLT
jgi:hypothetical protein